MSKLSEKYLLEIGFETVKGSFVPKFEKIININDKDIIKIEITVGVIYDVIFDIWEGNSCKTYYPNNVKYKADWKWKKNLCSKDIVEFLNYMSNEYNIDWKC